jgi:hypothetical protein
MKHLLLLPLVALVAACASFQERPPPTAQSDAAKLARLDLRICAVTHAEKLALSPDPARDVARTSVGNCTIHLVKLEDAVIKENDTHPFRYIFADAYRKAVHNRTVDEVAGIVMKARTR